jgi:uncharacterized protein (UPF0548 family)
VFRVGRVSTATLERLAAAAATSEPTYVPVGATLHGELPAGYANGHCTTTLGGVEVFDRATDGLRNWMAHLGAGLAVAPLAPPIPGATVGVAAPLGPISAVALCRVVEVIDEPSRYGFAYGTLPGHPERGEEAFVVERTDHETTFSVTVFSQSAELLARLGGPITRRVQRSATARYLAALEHFVTTSDSA